MAFLLCMGVHAQDAQADKKTRKPLTAEEAKAAIDGLPWKDGPGEAVFGDRARIPYGADFRVLSGPDAVKRLQMSGNRVDEKSVLGMLEHKSEHWWVVLQFDDVGYVKDDDKKDLDADKILEGYREGVAAENERRGGPPTEVVGWHTKPRYDEKSHNLEWAITFMNSGEKFINHQVRILGRKGVTRVTLVSDLEAMDATLPKFREAMKSFQYQTGESYAEYRPGDKVAKYGLTALVAGGAALGAAKLGLFGWLAMALKKGFKLIIVAFVALAGAVKKLFSSRSRSGDES